MQELTNYAIFYGSVLAGAYFLIFLPVAYFWPKEGTSIWERAVNLLGYVIGAGILAALAYWIYSPLLDAGPVGAIIVLLVYIGHQVKRIADKPSNNRDYY